METTLQDFLPFRDRYYREVIVANGHHLEQLENNKWRVNLRDGPVIFTDGHLLALVEVFIDHDYGFADCDLTGRKVVDIGAWIGDSAIYFALRGAEVYAFEPDSAAYRLAQENIRQNRLGDQVTLVNASVRGRSTVGKSEVTIPQIMNEYAIDRIDILKVDCEGCEFDFFLTLGPSVLNRIETVVMEYHDNPSAILRVLRDSGFEVARRGRKRLGHIYAWTARKDVAPFAPFVAP